MDVCVFCMNTAHQVAAFLLPPHMESPVWMGVGDGNVIVFESGPALFLFTISGHLNPIGKGAASLDIQGLKYHNRKRGI